MSQNQDKHTVTDNLPDVLPITMPEIELLESYLGDSILFLLNAQEGDN